MITFETFIKVGKSPKKPLMDMGEEEEKEESETDSESEEIYTNDEEANMECADRGPRRNDDSFSSGAEDASNIEQENGEDDESNLSENNITNKTKANPSWADAMRKVLHSKKPKRKKTIVLSKAKKLCEISSKEKIEPLPFEIETANGEIKKETLDKKQVCDEKKTLVKKQRRREMKSGIRVKPSILERERERTLQKIATKGVVQLFNAVRQQQIGLDKKLVEAGPLERKREKVIKDIDKRAFLDVLMGGTKSIQVNDSKVEAKKEKEASEEGKKIWKVLRDDFVMGASLKDWDKKKTEEDSSAPEEIESDE